MRAVTIFSTLAALTLAACDDGSNPLTAPFAPGQSGSDVIVYVEVIGPGNLELGESATYQAIAFTSGGDSLLTFAPDLEPVATDDFIWSSSDNAVLSVTGNGGSAEVVAVGDGTAEVVALTEGAAGSRTVQVGTLVVGPLARIELLPPDLTIVMHGDSAIGGIQAILWDENGNRIWDGSVAWTISDPTVLAVRSEQPTFILLDGLKAGTATVTADAEGISETAIVTVQ